MMKWTTATILEDLRKNNFENWQHWNMYEFKEFIKCEYDVSDYIATKVSYHRNEF